ncbi:MAG TPA: hypothetical protein V6D11_29210 [Waterburya sp.]
MTNRRGKLESLPSMLASSPVSIANTVEIKIPPVQQVLVLPVVLPETSEIFLMRLQIPAPSIKGSVSTPGRN